MAKRKRRPDPEVLPCPLCGGEAGLSEDTEDFFYFGSYVECPQCGIRMKTFWGTNRHYTAATYESKEKAAALWNEMVEKYGRKETDND